MNAPVPDTPAAPDISGTPAAPGNILSGNNPTPPPPAGTPSVWKTLTMGALWGLAGSAGAKHFGAGLAGGAEGVLERAPAAAQRAAQAQSDIRFKDAQAADMQADYAYKEAQVNALPQKVQDEHAAVNLQIAEGLQRMGFTPVAETADDTDSAMATGRNLTAQHGGVPSLLTLDLGGKHLSFDLSQMAGNPKSLDIYNRMLSDTGRKPLSQQEFVQMFPTPQQRVAAINTAANFTNPVIGDRKSLDQAKALLATMQAQPNPSSDLKADIDRLSKVIAMGEDTVKTAESGVQKVAADKAAAQTNARISAETSPENVVKQSGLAASKAAAEQNAKQATSNTLLVGTLPNGDQVAGTAEQLQQWGAAGGNKLPANEASKVVVARQLVSPSGLFAQVNEDLRKLDQEGRLGTIASRWNEFMTGKVGSDPEFAPLKAHMGLLSTALMQAHVGARGSEEMLKHFEQLADYKISDGPTLRKALGAEYQYVSEKAMLPKGK